MEELTKLEQSSNSDVESTPLPELCVTNNPSDSSEPNKVIATKPSELDDISSNPPQEYEFGGDCQDSTTNKACESSDQLVNCPIPSPSSGGLDGPKPLESNISIESLNSSQPLEACPSKSLDSPKCESSSQSLDFSKPEDESSKPPSLLIEEGLESSKSSTSPSKSGIESPSGGLDGPKPLESNTSIESLISSQPLEACLSKSLDSPKCESSSQSLDFSKPEDESSKPSSLLIEEGLESPKSSTSPSKSGIESPKSPYPSESSVESPRSFASIESKESAELETKSIESGGSAKSGSSIDLRRKSKLLATYSVKRQSKADLLATQLELVASEREKDVIVKKEFKEKEESLKDKRESIYKQMHMEQRKAMMDRKASTRKGSTFKIDLNASKKDMRKDDLNRKKEEDERNKQLLLQRAKDEKMLRKSIYASEKIPSTSSSPNSSSPPPDEKD